MMMETATGATTVTEAVPARLVVGSTAVTVADPRLMPVVIPAPGLALEMLAMDDAEELHVTELVMLSVEPSVYVPVAVSWLVRPTGMFGEGGVTLTLTSNAAVAVNVALPWMTVAGSVAVMVAVPVGPAVASPCDPAAFEITALALDEDQVALCVRFIVEPSV
jgi:hypothetical protein